jgi:hypothetical protein
MDRFAALAMTWMEWWETKKACRHLRRQAFVAAESSATVTRRLHELMERKTAR